MKRTCSRASRDRHANLCSFCFLSKSKLECAVNNHILAFSPGHWLIQYKVVVTASLIYRHYTKSYYVKQKLF